MGWGELTVGGGVDGRGRAQGDVGEFFGQGVIGVVVGAEVGDPFEAAEETGAAVVVEVEPTAGEAEKVGAGLFAGAPLGADEADGVVDAVASVGLFEFDPIGPGQESGGGEGPALFVGQDVVEGDPVEDSGTGIGSSNSSRSRGRWFGRWGRRCCCCCCLC